jgi:hypothetical protein
MNSWIESLLYPESVIRPDENGLLSPQQALTAIISARYYLLHQYDSPLQSVIDNLDHAEYPTTPAWQLPRGALWSMLDGHVEKGINELDRIRRSGIFDAEARSVAALLCGMAFADLNDEESAARVCIETGTELDGSLAPLTSGLLKLQAALRTFEIGAYETTQTHLNNAARALDATQTDSIIDPDVSIAIQNVLDSNGRQLARALNNVVTESLPTQHSKYWASTDKVLLQGLSRFLEDEFNREIRDTSAVQQHVVFANENMVARSVSSYSFTCQILGDVARARQSYLLVGRERMLRSDDAPTWGKTEGLKLLRRSGDARSLEAALLKVRAEGPLEALQSQFTAAVQRTRSVLNRANLTTIRIGAACTDSKSALEAFEAVSRYISNPVAHDTTGTFSVDDQMWRTFAALVPNNQTLHNRISEIAFTLTTNSGALFYANIRPVIDRIVWSSVTSENKTRWIAWAMQNHDGDAASVAVNVLANLAEIDDTRATEGLREKWANSSNPLLAATFVDLAASGHVGLFTEHSDAIADLCISHLRGIRDSAAKGSHGFGGIEISHVSAVFSSLAPEHAIWDDVVSYLADENVYLIQKQPTLDWLARNFEDIPPDVTRTLAAGLRLPADIEEIDDMFEKSNASSILRFLCRARAIDPTVAISSYLQLSDSSTQSHRVDAARSTEYICRVASPDIVVGTLLKLTNDKSVIVRGAANRQLPYLSTLVDATLRTLLVGKMQEALDGNGLTQPLSTMRGIESLSETHSSILVRELQASIETIASGSSAEILRDLSAALLQRVGSSTLGGRP